MNNNNCWLAFLLFVLVTNLSLAQYPESIKKDLEKRYQDDQKLQVWDSKKEQFKTYRDSMETALKNVCIKNLDATKSYFKDYGFPGIKENGAQTALHFWLIVQHGDHDVDFQNSVLIAMEKQLINDNVYTRNYPYLYDRVQKNKNKPQLYGTQIIYDEAGLPKVYNLENPNLVNDRRKNMGLETIELYLKQFQH